MSMKITLFVSNRTSLVAEQIHEFAQFAEIEVINLDDEPERAACENIWVTPTVVIDTPAGRARLNFFDRATISAHIHWAQLAA